MLYKSISDIKTHCTIQYNTKQQHNTKLVTHTMSVSWQNHQRCQQSLVAHGRIKKQQRNNAFKLHLHELTDGEMRIFRGMTFSVLNSRWPIDV